MSKLADQAINGFYHWLGMFNVSLAFTILCMFALAVYMLFRCLRRTRFLGVLSFVLQLILLTMATLVLAEKVLVIPAFELLFIAGGILLPFCFLARDFIGMKRRIRVSGGPVPLVERMERHPSVVLDGEWTLRMDPPGMLYPAEITGKSLRSPDAEILAKAREQLRAAADLLADGRTMEADGIYTFLSRLIPLDAFGLCNAGWLKHLAGSQDEALRLFRRALSMSKKREGTAEKPDWQEPESAGPAEDEFRTESTLEGGKRRAVDTKRLSSRHIPPAWFARFGLACAQFSLKQYEEALFGFQKTLVAGGANAALYRNMARCHLLLDCPDLAREELEQALVCEDSADTRLALAKLFLQMSLREGAVAQLEHLTATERDRAEPWRMLGTLYRREENWEKAEPCFVQLVKLEPGNADAWFRLGTCRRHLGRPEEALSGFRTAIRQKPDYSRALYGAAALLEEKGDMEEAASFLRQSLAGDEPMEKTYNLLAGIFQNEGRIRDSVAVYEEAISRYPESGLLQANLGAAQVLAGFHDRSLKPLKTAIRLGENDPGVYTILAKSLFETKHAHEAVRVLRDAVSGNPEDASLRYLSARAKARCHDTDGAIGDLEAAVALDADMRLEARACADFAAIRTAPGFIDLIRLPIKQGRP